MAEDKKNLEAEEAAAAAADEAAEQAEELESADAAGMDEAPAEAAEEPAARRPRGRPGIGAGIAHIRATFNNTSVSISDMRGNVVSWSSAGRAGFKGSRKSTAFAATTVAQEAARVAATKGVHEVEARVQGAGAGRESAIRGLQSGGLVVTMIKDVTPMPHNGCRPR